MAISPTDVACFLILCDVMQDTKLVKGPKCPLFPLPSSFWELNTDAKGLYRSGKINVENILVCADYCTMYSTEARCVTGTVWYDVSHSQGPQVREYGTSPIGQNRTFIPLEN